MALALLLLVDLGLILGVQRSTGGEAGAKAEASATVAAAPSTSTTTTPAPPAPAPATTVLPGPTLPSVTLVRGGTVPDALVRSLAALPSADVVVPVRAGQVLLPDPGVPGWVIPLEAVAIDPVAHSALLPPAEAAVVSRLAPGSALLGSTSARLRGLGAGGRLELVGRSLEIRGVVDDTAVGGAELVLSLVDAEALGVRATRFVLVASSDDPSAVRGQVDAAVAGTSGVLASELGPAPWPVSWREVLPQALVKERFGEFGYRPRSGRDVELRPGWSDDHIVAAQVPLLGSIRCHEAMVPALAAALGELDAAGLGDLVDPGDYGGCSSPRLTGPGAPISRHAWGLAVDVNVSANPFAAPATQDPRLVEVFERHGFAYGGRWPVPDGMHFEYRGA